MRGVVQATEGVRNCVDIADTCAGKGKACLVGRHEHFLTSLHVVTIVVRSLEVLEYRNSRLLGELVGLLGGELNGNISLNSVGQSVHAGCRGGLGRKIAGKLRVEYRILRDKAQIHDGVLVVRLLIGDDRGNRGLGARAGGSGNGNKGGYLVHDLEQTGHLVDGLVGVNYTGSCALCCVHGRTAAYREKAVAIVAKEHILNLVNDLDGGVSRDLAVVDIGDAGLVEGLHSDGGDGLTDGATGDDHDLFDAVFLKKLGSLGK